MLYDCLSILFFSFYLVLSVLRYFTLWLALALLVLLLIFCVFSLYFTVVFFLHDLLLSMPADQLTHMFFDCVCLPTVCFHWLFHLLIFSSPRCARTMSLKFACDFWCSLFFLLVECLYDTPSVLWFAMSCVLLVEWLFATPSLKWFQRGSVLYWFTRWYAPPLSFAMYFCECLFLYFHQSSVFLIKLSLAYVVNLPCDMPTMSSSVNVRIPGSAAFASNPALHKWFTYIFMLTYLLVS
jgi:hypothetical protein